MARFFVGSVIVLVVVGLSWLGVTLYYGGGSKEVTEVPKEAKK